MTPKQIEDGPVICGLCGARTGPPFIERWAATRGHLREITSGDVDAVLEPLRGHQRYNAITRCARCSGSPKDTA